MHLTFINGIPNDELKKHEIALEKIKKQLEKRYSSDVESKIRPLN